MQRVQNLDCEKFKTRKIKICIDGTSREATWGGYPCATRLGIGGREGRPGLLWDDGGDALVCMPASGLAQLFGRIPRDGWRLYAREPLAVEQRVAFCIGLSGVRQGPADKDRHLSPCRRPTSGSRISGIDAVPTLSRRTIPSYTNRTANMEPSGQLGSLFTPKNDDPAFSMLAHGVGVDAFRLAGGGLVAQAT
jgi:hypothetical protein